MDSLSRPFHRRKPSNGNGFSGKHAYDGVVSGHRPNGAPAVNVEEYREIFCTAGSSIPVLDVSNLEESSDDLNLEVGCTIPDYCKIFGGFRDQDIAISYEELVARDKARAPSSTSQSSQDSGDLYHHSFDALKQFNLSYDKISQRSKDGLDGTTHVTQLHAVPGFTCFVDESASQSNKGTVKQKSSSSNNVNVNSIKQDVPGKQTSQSSVEFSKHQEESLSDNKNFKTFESDLKSHPSKVSSSPVSKKETEKQKPPATNNVSSLPPATSQPKKENEKQKPPATNNVSSSPPATSQPKKENEKQKPPATNNVSSSPPATSQPKKENEKQKPPATNNVPSSPPARSQPKKETKKQTSVESQSRNGQDETFSDNKSFKTFQDDFKSYPSKVSSSHAANLDNDKDDQKRSAATNQEIPPACFDEEVTVNPASAALIKAIEKAQESIRIAKESVGRKKEGLRGFSSKSFKDSLKVKSKVVNVNAGEEKKEKDDKMKERDHKNGNFFEGEKLVGAKKVINEIQGKVSESVKNSEMPITSGLELNNNNDNKMVCDSKQVVGETVTESVENNACESPQKDDERPDGFLVLESCEKKQEDNNSNSLTVCQKVETKKEISQTSDQNGYEKKSSEESFGLLESNIQENLEQEHDEDEDEKQVKEYGGIESHSEEERFYDVCEAEMIKNAQTYAYNIETNDLCQKDDYENHHAEESYENSSSDYDDAEENENVIGASNVLDDTETTCKVDQNVDQAEVCQDIDDVSSRHAFQVEYTEAVEKEVFENISSDETENKDNVDFGQNDVQFESSLDSIHGMEIEVKDTVAKEENNLQQPQEQTPEIIIEMDAVPPQEPKDALREPVPSKTVHNKEETEQVRIKLAVERAIREAHERAFAEVRQRVIADSQEKVTKASVDKTSSQSKLRTERALVERATAEARQRALEKLEKQTSFTSQTKTESALRSKAKLEKHNRIMERAAKALAEKEKRDLLALREQAERNRLAEHLDADIKRWSTGKEGNLRALLSTLQYILGADSGWQAVSLTEIITTGAVKKAYRKATLCVHPDKLQQRGASIQQKYICEKVFDLLKAAWNRFNSEER